MEIIKLKTYHIKIDLCITNFEYSTNHYNDQSQSLIRLAYPHKTQKCKVIHLTVKAEIFEIDSLYPADLKKCWELIMISVIFLLTFTRCVMQAF